MRKTIFSFLTLALLIAAGFNIAGCTNTVHGAGQDVENAGESIQRSVEQ